MTELRRPNGHVEGGDTPRLHKQRHPLLQSLTDHGNLSSGSTITSGSSSATNTAATALIMPHPPCNGYHQVNANANGIEFDEHDLYYVSPSKRKGGIQVAPSYAGLRPANAYAEDCELDAAMQLMRGNSTSGSHNVVTFSNYVSEQRAPSTRASTPSSQVGVGIGIGGSCSGSGGIGTHNRGSLKRSKGRSNQSLCSCDAGDDADLKLDPAGSRPLYEYSLERRRKAHTYTCEQNAQILMRLERERNRKLSLTSLGGGGGGTGDMSQSDTPSLSDVDVIPPVPPPPAVKRNGSMRSLRLLQPTSLPSNSNATTINNNNNNNINNNNSSSGSSSNHHMVGIAQLCGSDLLQDCTKTALDECILQCASSNSNSHISGGKENNNIIIKPDICQPLPYRPPALQHNGNAIDDIFTPHSKKSDPSLCFLHPNGGGGGGGGGLEGATVALTQQQQQQPLATQLLPPPPMPSMASKYNTIGPSSDYARHLAHYTRYLQKQHNQQQLAHFQQQRCRCFSQSLSNFAAATRDNPPPTHQQQQQHHHHQQHHPGGNGKSNNNNNDNGNIFHTSNADWFVNGTMPINSRSYSNLVDFDGGKFQDQSIAAVSNFTMTSFDSASSGLKEKHPHHYHHQQQQPHQQHHSNRHSSHHQHHAHQHHQHHHHGHPLLQHAVAAAGGSSGGIGGGVGDELGAPQKHHQLHSSVTSIMPWKHRQCPSRGSSSSGTNSFRFDAAKHWLAVSSILLIIGAASVAVPLALRVAASAPFEERLRVAVQLLDQVPLIDGHNDLPWNIRKFLHNKLNDFNFDEDLRTVIPWARSHWSHTDLTRLKKGRISAQFWAAYVPCEAQHRDAVQLTLEQIDVIKRLTDRYSPQLTTCTSAQDIIDAHKNQQLCSLTGVEGGHSLGGSLAVLRTLYAIGVRYMTLTSTCHTPWADSSYADAPTFNMKHGGLTIFGKTIIREMNRLGMMVDLSHVSKGTMRDALEVSEAPVIFSHSSAYELCNTSRNVQDDILQSLAKNGGLVMVNFYSKFLSCSDNSTVHDAVAHINHIKRVAGIDHVGLGAGYDGINYTPKGLEDVSSYPTLFAELLGGGWSIDELTKLAGGNFLRVMQQVEKVRDDKKVAGVKPYEDHPNFRTDDPYNCTSS